MVWGDREEIHPGTSAPCLLKFVKYGAKAARIEVDDDPTGYPHTVVHSVYIRGSLRKSKSRSMERIGYYCKKCKRFLSIEEYGKLHDDWLEVSDRYNKGTSLEKRGEAAEGTALKRAKEEWRQVLLKTEAAVVVVVANT